MCVRQPHCQDDRHVFPATATESHKWLSLFSKHVPHLALIQRVPPMALIDLIESRGEPRGTPATHNHGRVDHASSMWCGAILECDWTSGKSDWTVSMVLTRLPWASSKASCGRDRARVHLECARGGHCKIRYSHCKIRPTRQQINMASSSFSPPSGVKKKQFFFTPASIDCPALGRQQRNAFLL